MNIDLNAIFAALGGRKVLAFVVCVLVVALRMRLSLSDDDVQKILYLSMTYISAQGIADGLSKGSTSSVVQAKLSADADAAAKAAVTQQIADGLAKLVSAQNQEEVKP